MTLCTSTGGHIVHMGSTLGQLDALPLAGYKVKIRDAKTIQQLMDLPYPAEEIAQARAIYRLAQRCGRRPIQMYTCVRGGMLC